MLKKNKQNTEHPPTLAMKKDLALGAIEEEFKLTSMESRLLLLLPHQ